MKTYTIKPLEWEGKEPKLEGDRVYFHSVFGSIYVGYAMISHSGIEYLPGVQWRWGYCFNEYYDEGEQDCESLEDGKRKAKAHYLSRLLPALVEVDK